MFNALLHSNTPKANNGKLNILCLLRFSRSVPKISKKWDKGVIGWSNCDGSATALKHVENLRAQRLEFRLVPEIPTLIGRPDARPYRGSPLLHGR